MGFILPKMCIEGDSFLNEQGQMNEAGSRMMRSGFLLCEAIVNLKPDWCESFVI